MRAASFLEVIKRCGAILLINGNVKEEGTSGSMGGSPDIKFDIQRKLGGRLKCAIVDAQIRAAASPRLPM